MTVRAWVTISAIAFALLTGAFALWLSRPARPPELFAVADARVRLEGRYLASCWPERGGDLRCRSAAGDRPDAEPGRLPREGSIRIVADYPAQPSSGTVMVLPGDGEDVLVRGDVTGAVDYELPEGRYRIVAEARYGGGAYVRWSFDVSVR